MMHISDRKHDQYMKMKREALSSPANLHTTKQFSKTQQSFNRLTTSDRQLFELCKPSPSDLAKLEQLQDQWNLQKYVIRQRFKDGSNLQHLQLMKQLSMKFDTVTQERPQLTQKREYKASLSPSKIRVRNSEMYSSMVRPSEAVDPINFLGDDQKHEAKLIQFFHQDLQESKRLMMDDKQESTQDTTMSRQVSHKVMLQNLVLKINNTRQRVELDKDKMIQILTSKRSSVENGQGVNDEQEVPLKKKPNHVAQDQRHKRILLDRLIVEHLRPLEQQKKKTKLHHIEAPSNSVVSVNITTATMDLDVVRKIVERNKWKYVGGFEGDILWTSRTITNQVALVYQKLRLSRIPSMRQMANKKTTSWYLNKFQEYFPTIYDFYPRTYSMPEDFQEFNKVYQDTKSSKVYIAKPDKGTQGLGIFILKELAQLFNHECIDLRHLKKGLVIQEYIQHPLLIDRKKFDLRLYVLITSVNPLVVYINDEGLARFCTEEYEEVSQQNLSNTYMHLTNYSLNKANTKFVHQPAEFMNINDATKRTYTSIKKNLSEMHVDVAKLKHKIEQVIIRFIYAMNPFLVHYILIQLTQQYNIRDTYQDKWKEAKNFHILGFDILVDRDLQPWILEVNANPSFDITQELLSEDGTKVVQISELDLYVKSRVIEDAFLLIMKDTSQQLKLIDLGEHFNSYKLLVNGQPPIPNIDLFEKTLKVFTNLCGHRFGPLNASKFCRLAMVSKLVNEDCMKSDYDLIYKRLIMKDQSSDMNFILFIEAIEMLAQKLLLKRQMNHSKQSAAVWVVERALEHFRTLHCKQNQSSYS